LIIVLQNFQSKCFLSVKTQEQHKFKYNKRYEFLRKLIDGQHANLLTAKFQILFFSLAALNMSCLTFCQIFKVIRHVCQELWSRDKASYLKWLIFPNI